MTKVSPDVANGRVRPFWTVQNVFDPDSIGGDFAYTVGLALRGLSELHLWARPTDGTDPGADWVPPGASVLPLRWCLEREPVGPVTGAANERRCRADLAALLATVPTSRKAPPGWRRPRPTAAFDVDQPFGPLTPLVLAQGVAVALASPVELVDFITRQLDADLSFGPRRVLALTAATARPVGRVTAVSAARTSAEQLVRRISGPPPGTARWREVLAITGMAANETPDLHRGMSGVLCEGLEAALTLQVVADVADDGLRLAGLGPWRAAASPSGMVAGPDWYACPQVLSLVRELLAPLDETRTALLAHMFVQSRDGWGDLLMRLRGLAVTSAAGGPRVFELLSGTPVGEFLACREVLDGLLTEWVGCIAAALSHRTRFSTEEMERLWRPTGFLLPGLRHALDAPRSVA